MADPHTEVHTHAAYQRGSQEIGEQASTYTLFMNLAKWGSLALAVGVLFLTMWFRPGGSFFGAFIVAVILAVAGGFYLAKKPKH